MQAHCRSGAARRQSEWLFCKEEVGRRGAGVSRLRIQAYRRLLRQKWDSAQPK
jgi:hypothetical protein